MKFTLRQLQVFATLAETEHFGRAAEQLMLSQPTVSSDLRSLERALKVELFLRSRAGTTLTEAGADLEPRARQVLAAAEELAGAAAEWADEPLEVPVAASPSLINRLVPDLLRELAENHPGLTVRVLEARTGGVENLVATNAAQLGLGHFVSAGDGMERGTVGHDPIRVLAAPQVLEGQSDEPAVDLSRLSHTDLLLWPRIQHPEYFDAIVALCHERGWRGTVRPTETRFTGANSYLLTAGTAFSLVSAEFAADAPSSLLGRPIQPPARIPLHAVWREPMSRGVAQVLSVLTELRRGVDSPPV